MPARSSKTKSPAEKAVPVIVTAPGRQRTLSTKQQLLRKLLILLLSRLLLIFLISPN